MEIIDLEYKEILTESIGEDKPGEWGRPFSVLDEENNEL